MKDRTMERWNTYEPFYTELGDKRVADITVTRHAVSRWNDRIAGQSESADSICEYLWQQLKSSNIRSYYRNEQDVYLVDGDIVMVAEFAQTDGITLTGEPLHKMIIVTFLGRMSETMELRDLKTYYSWLRHSRRMTLVKNSRKRK